MKFKIREDNIKDAFENVLAIYVVDNAKTSPVLYEEDLSNIEDTKTDIPVNVSSVMVNAILKGLKSCKSIFVEPTPKNKEFMKEYSLKPDDYMKIFEQITSSDFVKALHSTYPKYQDDLLFVFHSSDIKLSDKVINLKVYMKINVSKSDGDSMVAISFHKLNQFESFDESFNLGVDSNEYWNWGLSDADVDTLDKYTHATDAFILRKPDGTYAITDWYDETPYKNIEDLMSDVNADIADMKDEIISDNEEDDFPELFNESRTMVKGGGIFNEDKRSDWNRLIDLCTQYDPSTKYIDSYKQQARADRINDELEKEFKEILSNYGIDGSHIISSVAREYKETGDRNKAIDELRRMIKSRKHISESNNRVETYIEKNNKVSLPKFKQELSSYPVGTYIRLCSKGNINSINEYTYGKVKTADNEWTAYSSIVGYGDKKSSDKEVLDLIDKKNIKNIGVIPPKRKNESLNEDTIKQGNKWVNKGKEGTHGKFKTKKEADAQRRAMFANEYKEELTEDKHFDHYDERVRDAGYTDEEIAKVLSIADDYANTAQRHFITYDQMDQVADKMGLANMSDKELARAWHLYYDVISRESFAGDIDDYRKYSDAASAFAEVINREARKRKETGNYNPDADESLKKENEKMLTEEVKWEPNDEITLVYKSLPFTVNSNFQYDDSTGQWIYDEEDKKEDFYYDVLLADFILCLLYIDIPEFQSDEKIYDIQYEKQLIDYVINNYDISELSNKYEEDDRVLDYFKDKAIESASNYYSESLTEDVNEEDDEFYRADDGCLYRELKSKSVYDSDGFTTDYTLYMKVAPENDRFHVSFVTVFGDDDLYRPEDGNYDFECDTIEEALEWFNSYNGFEDDVDESLNEDIYRRYEDPYKLQDELDRLTKYYEDNPDEYDDYAVETIHNLKDRINFAWQDDEYDSSYESNTWKDDYNESLNEDNNFYIGDEEFNSRMLGRLISDCEYILGAIRDHRKENSEFFIGDRREDLKHLWAEDIDSQVNYMLALYDVLKPKNISREEIESYRKRLYDYVNGLDESLNEASYGGAFDIEDDMYFTREEINDFAYSLCDKLEDNFDKEYEPTGVYMETPNDLYIAIIDEDGYESYNTFHIDMRKIRKPSDLNRYFDTAFNWFNKDFNSEYEWEERTKTESLNEAYVEFNTDDGWTDEDIATWNSVDWKARNYSDYDAGDPFVSTVDLYGTPEPEVAKVEMHKFIRANPIFPPYYAPVVEKPFGMDVSYVGPMYDGNKYKGYDIHDRYETQDLYDTLSESRETEKTKTIKEMLNELDLRSLDEDIEFYDLKNLYEANEDRLDFNKKQELRNKLNDPNAKPEDIYKIMSDDEEDK